MDEATLAIVRDELKRRDDDYEAATGIKSSREIIARDAEWEATYRRLKHAELALAEALRKPGGCARYIPRRRRFCASRAADGCDGFCSLHAPSLGDRQISAPGREHRVKPMEASTSAPGEEAGDGTSSQGTAAAADNRRKTNIHRRMKKMTNPMAAPHRVPVAAPNWPDVYKDTNLPTFIDVGCAKGRFLQRAASVDRKAFEAAHGRHNLLGLEIYPPIVEDANLWTRTHDVDGEPTDEGAVGADSIGNLHFVACNANVSLAGMRVPSVRMVSVLFPDPWSRRKHAGRRVVTAQFVDTLAGILTQGARVYCCSDVRPLAAEMQALFLAKQDSFAIDEETFVRCGEMKEHKPETSAASPAPGRIGGVTGDGGFEHVFPAHQYQWQGPNAGATETNEENAEEGSFLSGAAAPRWLAANPTGVPTERDLVCESKWRQVYRFTVRRL